MSDSLFDDMVKFAEEERRQALTNNQKSKVNGIYTSDSLTFNEIEFVSLSKLYVTSFPEPRWLIDKVIPFNGISALSGVPKLGKSLVSLDLAYCVASEKQFLDEFKVQQGGVLIINKEDSLRLIKERFSRLGAEKDLPIHFCTYNNFYLDNDEYLDILSNFIKENDIKLIILDSFRRIFKGEENSSQVISEVHNRLKKLVENPELSILFTHHHGKEGMFKRKNKAEKLRGSSDILAMLDCLLVMEAKDDNTLIITQAALRQDKPLEPFLIKRKDNGSFNFLEFMESEKEIRDEVKDLVLEFLKEGIKDTTEIIACVLEAGYKETTTKYALKDLLTSKKIERDKSSRPYKYYLPTENKEKESEQSSLDI